MLYDLVSVAQIMACRLFGTKSLSEPMLTYFGKFIKVTPNIHQRYTLFMAYEPHLPTWWREVDITFSLIGFAHTQNYPC